jgi:hypothetical protein
MKCDKELEKCREKAYQTTMSEMTIMHLVGHNLDIGLMGSIWRLQGSIQNFLLGLSHMAVCCAKKTMMLHKD